MLVLREDQEAARQALRKLIREGVRKLLMQAPTGFGKTVLSSEITRLCAAADKGVHFLVHREELAKQASRTFDKQGIRHGLIMSGLRERPHAVQVAMIDTLRGRIKKPTTLAHPYLVIVDEAHHAVTPTWQRVIDYYAERGSVVIGMSATPERLDGRGLGDIFEAMVPGPSVKWLIERGALAKYLLFAPGAALDMARVRMMAGEYNSADLAAETERAGVTGSVIGHYKDLIPGKQAIVFAVNIAHSEGLAAAFNAAGIPAAHVDGEVPTAERKRRIELFERGELKVLSNVGLFGEGFDVPGLDAVIMARKTASLSLYLQMVGRALRPHAAKEHAVIIDHVQNSLQHGWPDDERIWTLEASARKTNKAFKTPIIQCPKCDLAMRPPVDRCANPKCGFVFPKRKTMEIVELEGKLVEVTPEMREQMRAARLKEERNARTLDELLELAQRRGHKPGWALRLFNARRAAAQAAKDRYYSTQLQER